ncbi:cysteine-rich receptor-like protein kinase 15 isoform X1 [Henckelia pumila]|uniref:cysteine-rich receptor-like protein kinase 15 isoform X1 n=1 Tax=Henckelia pumila TaxID=405737 RepID=UPI003C6DDAE2
MFYMQMSCLRYCLLGLVIPLHLSVSIKAISPYLVCVYNGMSYTSNSVYDSNLNTLLSSLPTNINSSGFYSASLGQNPDSANAVVLCRGDVQLETCRSCVQEASVDLVTSCPNHKQGYVWYELCMLRYSNESISGILAVTKSFISGFSDHVNVSSPDQTFKLDLTTLMYDLTPEAASGGTLRKVAAGNISTSALTTIFALEQCIPDLFIDDCISCLTQLVEYLLLCCDVKKWAVAFHPCCQIRFGTQLFYNETRLGEFLVPQLSSPPPLQMQAHAPLPSGEKDESTVVIIIVVSLAGAGLLLSIGVGVLFTKCIIKTKSNCKNLTLAADDISTFESFQFDFAKIRAATNDFSDANKLGEGGFGAVYKGELQNGREIAVKRLSMDSTQGHLEFKNEVSLMAKLHHGNLVRLLGFSIDIKERLLVYEFVHNASLDKFIFDPIKKRYLNWEQRYNIIMGIARGLVYLHEDSQLRIIHRDLKASNVLLDTDMNPKIADFGTARLFEPDETSRGNTRRIVGTFGYMPSEYAIHGQFSVKLDVFSFGVMIMEIVTGQKNNGYQNEGDANFISRVSKLAFENTVFLYIQAEFYLQVWNCWRQGTIANMIDPILLSGVSDIPPDMLRCVHIGLLCVQKNAADRPTMASVVVMLSSITITMPVPSAPAFFVSGDHNDSSGGLPRISSNSLAPSVSSSQNDTLITILYPR